ncbi:MAG: hypothetical protein K2W96_14565 [Gemmataceae bacterium]|nr:hypothetical protein [Gemmataceae bacterium]
MARCDEGYLCHACGGEVAEITDSDLYLAYVLGEVGVEELLNRPERHVRCNPERAQYIRDERFPPVACEGPFCREALDPEYVAAEEARVTAAWRRLQDIPSLGIPIGDYPLTRSY